MRNRVVLIAACAALALGRSCSAPVPPPATMSGLVTLLQTAAEVEIRTGELGWEPSAGPLRDLFIGRELLFLGAKAGEHRDLYRARVRVSWEGKPLGVSSITNLTQTPLADEVGLQVSAGYAVYSTLAGDALVAVSLLEPRRDLPSLWRQPAAALAARAYARERHGSWSGLTETHFDVSDAASAAVALSPPVLGLDLGPGRNYTFGLQESAWINAGDPKVAAAPKFWRMPAAALPDRAWLSRLKREVFGAPKRVVSLEPALPTATAPDQPWPPSTLAPSAGSSPGAGISDGGQWLPIGPAAKANEPALMFHTQVNVAGRRIDLVAFDTRRLDLRLHSGFATPRAWTGPNGSGRVSLTTDERQRLLAVFNGGDEHSRVGSWSIGLISGGRVEVPPSAGLATLAVTETGFVGLGAGPDPTRVNGFVSLRQAATSLSPKATSAADDAAGERSALCLRTGGLLLFAWARDFSRVGWGNALADLGCAHSLELASGAAARGLALLDPAADGAVAATPLLPEMSQDADGFAGGAAQDFFYVSARASTVQDSELTWQVSPGAQPEPSYVPGLFSARTEVGGLLVELFAVDPHRVQFGVTAGTEEPLLPSSSAPVRELSVEDKSRALFAFNLGHTTRATRYGLTFDTRETLPLRRVYATLTLAPDGSLEIASAGEQRSPVPGTIQVQLPALVADGQLVPRAHEAGSQRRRGALCVLDDGRLMVAFVDHDSSDPLALVLRERGCKNVLELDRASQHAATLYRAGTTLQIPEAGETSLLIGLSKPMAQRTFVFGEQAAAVR